MSSHTRSAVVFGSSCRLESDNSLVMRRSNHRTATLRRSRAGFILDDDSAEQRNQDDAALLADTACAAAVPCRLTWGQKHSQQVPPPVALLHQWIDRIRPHCNTTGSCSTAYQDGSSSALIRSSSSLSSWDDIIERCQTQPGEVTQLDRRGRTCLHAACAKKPPLRAIQVLLQECGRSAIDDCLVRRDNHGRTPIAIAICSNASFDVISELIAAYPDAAKIQDHLGQTPLHLACAGYNAGQDALVAALLQRYPQATAIESINGRTPLHAAIEARAPVSIVRQLVKVYPDAVLKKNCGLNPLFVALRLNATLETVKCLVDACPHQLALLARDRAHALPFRRAVEHGANIDIQTCLCRNNKSIILDSEKDLVHNTILHAALEGNFIKETTVELMVSVAPEIALRRSKSGQTPLILACNKWMRQLQRSRISEMWNIIEILIRAAAFTSHYHTRVANWSDVPILHATVLLQQLPWKVITHVIHLYKKDICIPDAAGDYPIHLAVASICPPELVQQHHHQQSSSLEALLTRKQQTIYHLFSANVAAISYGNHRGQSALSFGASALLMNESIVQQLCRANPTAIQTRDPFYGLYPFQIAAMPKRTAPLSLLFMPLRSRDACLARQECMQLEVIYTLLRHAPELLVA